MNASYEWLKDFVEIRLSPAELRDLITSRCATVDEIMPLRSDLQEIVVARVVEAARHPDAERLTLTKVDAGGDELLEVVCGAPNVKVGSSYPFAPLGAVLPGGLTIAKRKIRGHVSNGMLCSARELGLGDEHEGILELVTDAPPGTPLLRAMPVGDTRLVIDVLPNRPDLLSHLGIAREIAAATGKALDPLGHYRSHADSERLGEQLRPYVEAAARGREVLAELVERREESGERVLLLSRPRSHGELSADLPSGASEGETGDVRVAIEDVGGCPRYLGVVLRGVKVGPSPDWLARRIESVGGRPINNVVDVTNFMLHGFGQPMHAFDVAKLAGPAIIIRRARQGERLTTLDGVSRTLDPSMTVIADAARAQAIAGVIGGLESEVTADTTDIFLEVAAFDPRAVRATRRKLSLSTDASYRFERGTDVESAAAWLAHAVLLLVEVAGGDDALPVDLYPAPQLAKPLPLHVDRVRRLLGEPVSANHIRALLEPIGFTTAVAPGTEMLHGSEELRIVSPSWRRDLAREVDLIEEVARLRGYDSFSSELRPFRPGTVPDDPLWLLTRGIRTALSAEGLLEARPIPFTRAPASDEKSYVKVSNPIAENEGFLRRELLDTLARRAELNLARMQGNVRLFEIGSAFAPVGGPMPREELRVAALIMGQRRPPHFSEPKPPLFDEWDAKALGEVMARAGYPDLERSLEVATGDALWTIHVAGELRGRIRRLSLDAPVWAAPAFGVELTLALLDAEPVAPPGHASWAGDQSRDDVPRSPREEPNRRVPAPRRFRPLPTTPAAEFDLALLVPDSLPAERVEGVLHAAAGDLLERLELFDEYRGSGVPEGMRSLAWRLTFRHPERTLNLKEIEGRRSKLLRALESELGVRQRAG